MEGLQEESEPVFSKAERVWFDPASNQSSIFSSASLEQKALIWLRFGAHLASGTLALVS
jgi:hypothetical protein